MLVGSQNVTEKVPTTINMEPKGCQSEPTDVLTHTLGNRVEKVRKKGANFGPLFLINKVLIQQAIKQNVEKHDIDTIWMTNEAKIDVETHQQSMPKQVMNKIANTCVSIK